MAITSISRIQHRRGLKSDLPAALAEGELGWCLDTRELFIGNSGAYGLNTQILTQWSANDSIIRHKFEPLGTTITTSSNRSIGEKLDDFISIKDFGVEGDGSTDDSSAINAAIASLFYAVNDLDLTDIPKHVTLYFPPGVYVISESILLYPYVSIVGAGIDKTIIKCINGTSQTYMIETVDSTGDTDSNIGLTGYYPKNILVSSLTLDTNATDISIASMVRYQNTKFDTVKFKGSYQLGDGLSNSLYAVGLKSIGNTGVTYSIAFVDCIFTNTTYGIYSDDPVEYTSITRCTFTNCWSGITLGLSSNFGGPTYATANQCKFIDIDQYAIYVAGTNPGIVSTASVYNTCNLMSGSFIIYWNTGTTLNGSIGDVFDATAVYNNGTYNIIANAQQGNLGDAWTTFSPTITPNTGTFTSTSVTGRYKQIGKLYMVEYTVNIVNNGTAGTYYTLTLPNGALAQGGFAGSGADNNTGASLSVSGRNNNNNLYIFKYDGTYSGASGTTQWISCTFESV